MKTIIDAGFFLKNSREKKGIPISEASRVLKIRRQYLQNIEDGDWSMIPGNVYLRGYLKQYCNFLNIGTENFLKILNFSTYSAENFTINNILKNESDVVNGNFADDNLRIETDKTNYATSIISEKICSANTKTKFFSKIFLFFLFFLLIIFAFLVYNIIDKRNNLPVEKFLIKDDIRIN